MCSEFNQTYKMELFAKIVNSKKLTAIDFFYQVIDPGFQISNIQYGFHCEI